MSATIKDEICILNCDSPSYPPDQSEMRQCGCRLCLQELSKKHSNMRVGVGRESTGPQQGGPPTPEGPGWRPNKPLMRREKAVYAAPAQGWPRGNFQSKSVSIREIRGPLFPLSRTPAPPWPTLLPALSRRGHEKARRAARKPVPQVPCRTLGEALRQLGTHRGRKVLRAVARTSNTQHPTSNIQ